MKNRGHDHETTAPPVGVRAIAAFSGGLDSILAALLVHNLGIPVTLLHVQHLFSGSEETRARLRTAAAFTGLPLRIIDASEQHLEVIRRPRHGYGRGMNPCIDCRIFMLRVAKDVMESENAQFVITGEVLGQRPKSQHLRALEQAAEESGLGDRLLRPLSANLLPDTLPVKRGWLHKEDLLSIQGRSRARQVALAAAFGVTDYPQPAGGCVLIEPTYAARVRDAFEYDGPDYVDLEAFRLMKIGRHFRLSARAKAIVGRNQGENEALEGFAGGRIRIEPVDVMGPTTLVDNTATDEDVRIAACLAARYADHGDRSAVAMKVLDEQGERTIEVAPLLFDDPRIAEWRIGG